MHITLTRGLRVAAVVVALAAVCVSALTATAATNRHRDNVNITWMMFETSNLPLSYWQDIVNRFEAKNPGITVTLLPSPTTDRDAYAKQLLASGQFPDVLQSITLQDYTSQGLLYPWTPAEHAGWNVLFPHAEQLGGMFSAGVLGKDPNWIVQRKANKVHFTDALVAHRFNEWAALAKAGYFNKDALSLNYAGMQQEFLDGKEAMYPMGTWAASATAVGAAKFGTGVFRLPPLSGSPVQAVFTNGGAVVSAKSAHLDAAKKLAAFWTRDPPTNATL